ncbi:NKAP domain containing 1 [Scomber japonicus]|uniref:NKAP domain containing 1 n=1 Tax=Scomber japonicus TaxID=13676 RepID=UPI0023058156|nr:NKAP domain containing 1 [Scomber japonicus]
MSKQPLGKTLLRNVIRHTDAHNKIQEEMEMWKMRGWEVKGPNHKHSAATECVRGSMHCDRVSDESRDQRRSRERASEHDDREARYWTRKLYEFEANDPDRWGHSGFKELYPDEFISDSEKNSSSKKMGRHKMKKSKSETSLSKHKKFSQKKKKKKKKKDEGGKRKKDESSSSSDDSSAAKDKQRRKRTKSRHKNKKASKNRGREEDSSSGDSDDHHNRERERQTHSRKRRKQDSHKDSGLDSKKKRRKNWKAVGEESSDDTSGD